MTDLRASTLADALRDPYLIERELGRGGMATVYLARDLRHTRSVALKVLHPELAAALGSGRFLQEISTTARLQHPLILPLFDSGESNGHLWYTMPYVEGESLRQRLNREKQLPLDDAIQIARNVLGALAYAHECGVVHRDIKPENILLERGVAVLGDFGIAQAVTVAGSERLTETGLALGTPAYMSPEQGAGERSLNCRSDLYSMGCVLYEMLAGAPPFTGPSAQAVLARHAIDPVPPIRTVRKTVPRYIEEALHRALAKVPADRFGSAVEFAEALFANSGASAQNTTEANRRTISGPTARTVSSRRRSAQAALGALGLAALAGLSIVVGQWRRPTANTLAPPASTAIRIAVLPFESQGDSADAYFGDGVTDAVRGKLTEFKGLEVIARTSSMEYRSTRKSLSEVARDLSVRYLLTGTVRWARVPGQGRVRVTPELIEARTGAAKWQESFDAPVTDIFQVQASIAERVAQALDIALSEKEHRSLAQRPTEAFGAYDAFLKGEQLSVRASAGDLSALRQAIRHYRQAVALDPDFVMAWVRLATLHSYLHAGGYGGGTIDPAEANAGRDAAIRALKLRPGGYEGHLAMGAYYFSALADYRRALDEATQGLRLTPNQPELLDVAASAEMSLGLWDSALVHYQREQSLDPRSVDAARGIATVLLFMRHYREALAATNRGLLLDPEDPHLVLFKALIYLGLEDLAGAQKAIGSSPRREGVPVVVLTDAVPFWLLEAEDQRRLVQLGPATFDEDRGTWGSALAQTYWLLGDRNKARIYADSARMTYQAQLTNSHDPMTDALRHSSLGLMLAYLGQAPDAVSQGTRGRSLLPVATNAVWGAYVQYQGAYIYTLLGDPERALNLLEPLVRGRSYLSAGWLQFDPALEALRANPRFKRLIETARRSSG